jgi:hypothetical protein
MMAMTTSNSIKVKARGAVAPIVLQGSAAILLRGRFLADIRNPEVYQANDRIEDEPGAEETRYDPDYAGDPKDHGQDYIHSALFFEITHKSRRRLISRRGLSSTIAAGGLRNGRLASFLYSFRRLDGHSSPESRLSAVEYGVARIMQTIAGEAHTDVLWNSTDQLYPALFVIRNRGLEL